MTIRHRLDAGWSLEKALTVPVGEQQAPFNLSRQLKALKEQQDRLEEKLTKICVLLGMSEESEEEKAEEQVPQAL